MVNWSACPTGTTSPTGLPPAQAAWKTAPAESLVRTASSGPPLFSLKVKLFGAVVWTVPKSMGWPGS